MGRRGGKAGPEDAGILRLAERIRADYASASAPGGRLPNYRRLRAHYRASQAQVTAALRVLANMGFLEIRPRSGVRVIAPVAAPAPESDRSADRLYRDLVDGIRSGTYPAGSQLPKIHYLARTRSMAARGVREAYGRLVAGGLAHRKGKAALVGRAPADATRTRDREPPVFLVLTRSPRVWEGLCRSPRNAQFGHAFLRECERHGIQLEECVAEARPGVPEPRPVQGRAEIAARLRALGPRYRGALMVANRAEIPDIEAWARYLRGRERPVAWFDRSEEGFRAAGLRGPGLFRCHPSEAGAARAAVDALRERGHRRAAFLRIPPEAGWQGERAEGLRRIGAQGSPVLDVTVYTYLEDRDWLEPGRSGIREALARAHGQARADAQALAGPLAAFERLGGRTRRCLALAGTRGMSRRNASAPYAGIIALAGALWSHAVAESEVDGPILGDLRLIWNFLGLAPVLRDPGITAILGPNDAITRGVVLAWLRDLRLRVPDHYSLLSFDNAFRETFFPLSSVDMGFGDLGYQAFHALLGDIPVRADRAGNIPARPKVIHRGSLGPPRETPVPRP